MKPQGYPLPWCDALDAPYWRANLLLGATRPGWTEWQARKDMREIIPEIDRVLAEQNREQDDEAD